MNSKRLTVITVVRNDQCGLNKTIHSVSQELPWAEHLVIDGSDRPLTILGSCSELVSVFGSDRGISHAFNKGILLARGEYVVFVNAGDTFISGAGGAVLEALVTGLPDCVWFSVYRSYADGRRAIYAPRLELLHYAMAAPHQGMIVKRMVFSEIGLFPMQRYSMDHHFALRLILRRPEYRIDSVRVAIVDYPAGGHSTQGGVWPFVWNCWNVARIRIRSLPVAVCANIYLAIKSCVLIRASSSL